MKYIDDPFKKVSYSFRIEEKLLEDIKSYADGTGRKLPETFNHLLKKSLEGVNVNNDYLKGVEGLIINITFMEYQKHTTTAEDPNIILNEWYTYTRGATDYTNFNFDGLLYNVDRIPNNLDVWQDNKGYYSPSPELIHEGVSVVIIPELILHDKTCITREAINNSLKFIYFSIKNDNTVKVRNISYKDCFRRLKRAGNDTDLNKFMDIDTIIYKFSNEFMKEYNADPNKSEKLGAYKLVLYNELNKFAEKYNDGNITSIEESTANPNGADPKTSEMVEDIENNIINDYIMEIDKLKRELAEKDKTLKEYIGEMDKRLTALEKK